MTILFVKQFFRKILYNFSISAYTCKKQTRKAGEILKFFKPDSKPDDGYTRLLDNLKQTTTELQTAYENLENVVEPDLIDYYIYQAKAVQMRYKFLLGCVKRIEGSYTKNPL